MRFHFSFYNSRIEFVKKIIDTKKVTLLDAGNLGDGESNCAVLRKDVEKNGGEYYGLDSNEALAKKLDLPRQYIGDLHHTEFENEKFDMIYAGEIIEHTWTPAVMINECNRILKKGGLLILDTPNPYATLSIVRFLFFVIDWMGDDRVLSYYEAKNALNELEKNGEYLLQPQHKIFFTPAMLKQLFETHGFTMESIGCTIKPQNYIHRILLWLFPHTGRHLCVVARKTSIDEAFADIVKNNNGK
jgi:SAM-dependent methyltransferase